MKRIVILSVLISALSFSCFSQNIRLGINAGGTFSFMKSQYQGRREIINGMKAGLTAGVVAEVPFAERLCFTPSLNLTQKGGNYRFSFNGYSFEGKRTLNYIELLLNVVYSVPVPNGKIFVGIGPGLSTGINGKYRDEVTYAGQTQATGDINFGNKEDEDDYKPLDLGGNIMAGYEFSSGFFMALNYYLGLNNVEIHDNNGNTAKNRYFGFRFGYFLSKKAKPR